MTHKDIDICTSADASPSHNRHRSRTACPPFRPPAYSRADVQLFFRTAYELWPWRVREYPGWHACAAAALGYAQTTVSRMCQVGSRPFPVGAARKLSVLLKSKARTFLELAAAWDAYADQRVIEAQARAVRPFRTMALEERQGWRSAPRAKR